jgi:hypothetical protein
VEEDRVRTALSILLAVVVESVCYFGLVVIVGGHPSEKEGEGVTLPEWIGKWLTDRAEPHPGARVNFFTLEADFRRWAMARDAPQVSSRRFKRLMRAACRELGLAVDHGMVTGLQLTGVARLLTAAE